MTTKIDLLYCARIGLLIAVLLMLLAGCASPQQSAIALPPLPKPQATADIMKPLPEPSSFRTALKTFFGVKPIAPTK